MKKRTVALSLSFSDGGAERVLASIINSGEAHGISLSDRIDYVIQPEGNLNFLSAVPKNRILALVSRLAFLIKMTSRGERILVCSHDLFLILVLLNALRLKKYNVIYRPSIDANFVKESMAERFGFLFPLAWWVFVRGIRRARCVFQTPVIKRSFEGQGFSRLNGKIIPNPVDMANSFKSWSYNAHEPIRFLYVGRQTRVKGFDRHLAISAVSGQEGIAYEHYGRAGEVGVEPQHRSTDMGWVDTQNISSQNAVLILPSRLEGLPNVLLEALAAEWPVVVSVEVANLLNHLPIVRDACLVVDFEKHIDEPLDVQNLLRNNEFVSKRSEAREYIAAAMDVRKINREIISFCEDIAE